MAKFYGEIGYGESVETYPGVWEDVITERHYYGDVVGERFFETGIDRGVLYVDDNPGVAWSGLTSVNETTASTDPQMHYFDGVNYLNVQGKEEFKANLSAFYSPKEFDECDGSTILTLGFQATQQRRKTFGLSYRSKIGNDLNGSDHGYKIHLIYDALASPTEHNHSSIGEDADVTPLSWDITTKPQRLNGYAPTAHYVIDSTRMHPMHLKIIEDILYGGEENDARLLTPKEILDLMESNYQIIDKTNITYDPSFEYGIGRVVTNPNGVNDIVQSTDVVHSGTYSLKITPTEPTTRTYNGVIYDVITEAVEGVQYHYACWVYVPETNVSSRGGIRIGGYAAPSSIVALVSQKGVWERLVIPFVTDEPTDIDLVMISSEFQNEPVYFDDMMLVEGPLVDDFNGDTPGITPIEPFGSLDYIWRDTPGDSYSDLVYSFGYIEKINYYPDPSHEYGIAPFDAVLDTGSGTVELDILDSHTGNRSIKITNTYPATVQTENLFHDPSFTYGRGGWHAYSDGSAELTTADGAARTGTQCLSISSVSYPAMADIDSELPVLKRNTKYTVSAWVSAISTSSDVHFRYQSSAGSVDGEKFYERGWHRIKLTFTTGGPGTEGTDDIYLRCSAKGGSCMVDDVSLIEGEDTPISSKDIRYLGRHDDIPVNQGIAYGGQTYYTVQSHLIHSWIGDINEWSTALVKRTRDISNDYTANTTHVSAPLFHNNQLIAPIHNLPYAVIGKWDYITLEWEGQVDVIGAPDSASSALAYDPITNEFIMTGYYDEEISVQRYNENFEYLGFIDTPIRHPQGITYFDNKYYINADCPELATADNPLGRGLMSINRDGSDLQMIISDPIQEMEGVCIGGTGNLVRAVRDNNKYFIKNYEILGPNFSGDTPTDKANSIYEWSGTPGASSSLRFRQGSDPARTALNLPTMKEMGLRNGNQFTWSAWVKLDARVAPDVNVLSLSGPAVTSDINISPPVERDEWVKVSGTTTVADENQNGVWQVYAGNNSGDIIHYDDFAIELGTETDDFNGDTASDPHRPNGRYIYRWRGVPGNSVSEKINTLI